MASSGKQRVAAVAVAALSLVTMAGCTIEGNPLAAPQAPAPAAPDLGFAPSAADPDPSARIPGIVIETYSAGLHVTAAQRVAYDHSPPFGGRHDGYWAACNGVVYPNPVRSENIVHSMEHGAVWIAYNPDQVSGDALGVLRQKVESQPYTLMSPYPGLDQPISLQSWGHQLKVTDVDDPRIDQFIAALRLNQYTYPEPGASCNELGPPNFSQASPPPVAPVPAPGTPGSVPETSPGTGVTPDGQ